MPELAFCQTYLVRHYFAFDIIQPDAFPPELWLESFSYLEHRDHKALTKTCSLFADLARTYIFSILTFDGNKQGLTVRRDGRGLNRTIGRTKTIEWAHLPKAVDKLCDLAIPRFVKTFKFSPAFYVSDFWTKFRAQLSSEVNDPNTEYLFTTDMETSSPTESCRLFERRVLKVVKKKEKIWKKKIIEQNATENAADDAIKRLLKDMKFLKSVEISNWSFNIEHFMEHVGSRNLEDSPKAQYAGAAMAWKNFEAIASGLRSANNTIISLKFKNFDPSHVVVNADSCYVFAHLTNLTLHLATVDFLTPYCTNPRPELAQIMQLTLPGLKHLKVRFWGKGRPGKCPRLQNTLDSILCAPRTKTSTPITPFIFPYLETLKLSHYVLYSPSLTAFLAVQPSLRSVFFKHVTLAAVEERCWATVASLLPASLETWKVEDCGIYNQASEFWKAFPIPPEEDVVPKSTGWKAVLSLKPNLFHPAVGHPKQWNGVFHRVETTDTPTPPPDQAH